jgi:integrase
LTLSVSVLARDKYQATTDDDEQSGDNFDHGVAGVGGGDAGADVLKVATALGHASPSTTMRYVRGRDVITHSPVHAVATAIVNG